MDASGVKAESRQLEIGLATVNRFNNGGNYSLPHTRHTARTGKAHSFAPRLPGFSFDAFSVPAERMSGDSFKFFPAGSQRLGVLIFDVSGKGVEAAGVAHQLSSFFQTQTRTTPHVKDILRRANDFLSGPCACGHFATALYGILDPKCRRFTFARAGHEPLMWVHDNHTEALAPSGLPLGIGTPEEFDESLEVMDVELHTNDRLFLFTDGLSETFDATHNEFGHDRIASELCASRGNDIAALTTAVKDFAGGEPAHDDLTMVSICVKD